jgi:hypothetical protein
MASTGELEVREHACRYAEFGRMGADGTIDRCKREISTGGNSEGVNNSYRAKMLVAREERKLYVRLEKKFCDAE